MSNWTHVAGVMRIDSFSGLEKPIDFSKEIGKECLFDSPMSVWDEYDKYPERFLPCGDEGTLHMSVWENPKKNHLSRYVVTIWGDLRDYENYSNIIDWFKEKCKKFSIRQASITIRDEWSGTVNWVYYPHH